MTLSIAKGVTVISKKHEHIFSKTETVTAKKNFR